MSDVKSKNLYELLGNTSDQDSDREVEVAPNKSVDKTAGRSGKRDAPKAAPTEPVGEPQRGGRGARRGGSDGAFRDRNAGRDYNRSLPTEGEDGNRGARRGGRGPRGPRRGGDRRDRTGQNEHTKQADASWGGPTGDKEWADEQAGEAIAKKEEASGWGSSGAEAFDSSGDATKGTTGSWNAGDEGNPDFKDSAAPAGNGFDEEPEPEDNSKSYADYVAEQAEKKLQALGLKEARAPNEGQKENKQWKNAKPLSKDEEGEYFQGKEEKARRERERKVKEKVDIDFTFKEPERGGRGGPRGGRGRGDGEFRGRGGGRGRGDGEFRGRGGGRGSRGSERGERGEFRGSRGRGGRGRGDSSGNGGAAVSLDESAFPSLGAK